MNETMVTVTGNVASDVIAKRVGSNQEHLVVNFRVASSERRYDKATDTWFDGDRFTASVNCWRRLAEGARMLVKGDPVVVTGRLSVREYEVEGVRRYMTEISATAVGPDLSRCEASVKPWRADTVEGVEPGEVTESTGPATADAGAGLGGVVTTPAEPAGASVADGPAEAAAPSPEGATVTGIGAGERRRPGAARVSA
jgi:single-strand DNA-binding protein